MYNNTTLKCFMKHDHVRPSFLLSNTELLSNVEFVYCWSPELYKYREIFEKGTA